MLDLSGLFRVFDVAFFVPGLVVIGALSTVVDLSAKLKFSGSEAAKAVFVGRLLWLAPTL